MGSSSGFLEEASGWSFSIISPSPLPSQLPACGHSQTHQLHHFLFSFAFIPVLEAIPEVGAVYTLEMCRILLVSFALVPFSFCFSLLAFGEGCAEPGELNPNPLSSFKSTKNLFNPHLLAQKDGFERDDGDLPGLGLPPVLFPPHRSEFPLADPVGIGVILSWFGMSQVLWVSFWGIFCVLLVFCCFHVGCCALGLSGRA